MTGTNLSPSDEYPQAFIEAVHQAAAVVGWQFHHSDAEGLVFVNRQGVQQSIGLRRFYSRFSNEAPSEWPARIAEYFQTVIALTKGERNDDLNAQADRVLVRLGQPYPSAPPVSVWSRPFPETDLAVMLVIEEGGGVALCPRRVGGGQRPVR
jgi:hypothetical protein